MKYFKVLFLSTLCLLIGVDWLSAQNTDQGLLTGEFSVSATKKVRFSQGNLQFQASTSTWQLADNQYDFITYDNENASSSYSGWIDLFGYGTSGWKHPDSTYQNFMPWHYTVSKRSKRVEYAYLDADMTGVNDSADWGVYNAINNGGGRKGLWRVLSRDEWDYLLNDRCNGTAADYRFKVRVKINNTVSKMGELIFPDYVTPPSYLSKTGSPTAGTGNDLTIQQYNSCVQMGAVFMVAGGTTVDQSHPSSPNYVITSDCKDGNPCEYDGIYWTSTCDQSRDDTHSYWTAYRLWFWDDPENEEQCILLWCWYDREEDYPYTEPRLTYNCSFHRHSVRLVREIHTVTFYDYYGNPIKTEEVLHGNYATPPADPTRPYDCYDYVFTGWTPDATKPVTENKEFHPNFAQGSKHSFTVTYLNWNDSVVETQTGVKCGDPITTKNTPTRPCDSLCYSFRYWYRDRYPDSAYTRFDFPDTVVRAEFKVTGAPYYRVTWLSNDGSVLCVDSVRINQFPPICTDTARPSTCEWKYRFVRWNKPVTKVTSDQTYIAVYDSTRNLYNVKWVNWDGSLLATTQDTCHATAVYPSDAPVPTRQAADSIYTFIGWNPAVCIVTGDTTIVAVYSSVKREYSVTFISFKANTVTGGIETVRRKTTVEYNNTPAPIGSDSAGFQTCAYNFEFAGWVAMTPESDTLKGVKVTDPVAQDLVFMAQYIPSRRQYTMTWKEMRKTTPIVQYYDSVLNAPTPQDSIWTDSTIYVFTGWTPSLKNVPCGDTTFTANYKTIDRYYDVIVFYRDSVNNVMKSDTLKKEFGTILNFDTFAYDVKYCDYTHKFDYWDPSLQRVTENSVKIYRAQYNQSLNIYDVYWREWDGSLITKDPYYYGQRVTKPADRAKRVENDSIYFFTGWTPAPEQTMPCKDTTYTATYRAKARYYIDTLITKGDTILDTVPYDSLPKKLDLYGKDTVRCDSIFYFENWSPNPTYQDTVSVKYVANYSSDGRNYSVTWKDWNGRTLVVQTLHHDSPITVPTDPSRSADADSVYFFKGWSPEPAKRIDCDHQEYVALYTSKPRQYMDTIIVLNDTLFGPTKNDTLFEQVPYGNTPDLTKYAKDITHCDSIFTFSGWEPALQTQDTAAVKYVAKYTPTVNMHTIVWKDWNGSVLKVESNEYGSAVVLPATPDTYKDAQYVYFFNSWSQPPVATTMPCNDLTYTATYDKYQRYYNDSLILLEDTLLTDPIEYGTTPDLKKYQSDVLHCDTLFQFKEWSPAPQQQGVDTIKYVALYDTILNLHSVTWIDYNNNTLKFEKLYKDAIIVAPDDPVRDKDNNYVYFFDGWKPTFVTGSTMPCNDLVYQAQYTKVSRYYNDTIVRFGGEILFVPVEYGETPNLDAYKNNIVNCDTTFAFKTWSPLPTVQDTDLITYVAIYDTIVNEYNVTWKDYDGDVIASRQHHYNDSIYIPDDPTRQPDASRVYFFSHWHPAIDTLMPCSDKEYEAKYNYVDRYYVDTIKLQDTTYTKTVEYGTTPDLSLYAKDVVYCDHIYVFTGWSPEVAPQGDTVVTYTAIYRDSIPTYTTTWRNWNGELIEQSTYAYNERIKIPDTIPTHPIVAGQRYFFTGWSPVPDTVMPCHHVDYEAQFTNKAQYYYDTVIRFDSLVDLVPVEYDSIPNLKRYENDFDDCMNTYRFKGWVPDPDTVTQDTFALKFVAQYDTIKKTYYVTWKNLGQVYQQDSYNNGAAIVRPSDPNPPTSPTHVYFFNGWTPTPVTDVNCTSLTYDADYRIIPRYYVDTIVRQDTTYTKTVEYGKTPDLSQYATDVVYCDVTYHFTGWSPEVSAQGDTVVTYVAQYDTLVHKHKVTWKKYDGTVIDTASYLRGQSLVIPADPVRPTDYQNQTVYFFIGWTPAVVNPMDCNDATYTATYREKPLYYKDTIHTDHGDTTIVVEYGKTPDLSEFDDDIPGCEYTLKFTGWTPAVQTQDTVAVRYTALYDTITNRYKVTWKRYDGSVLDTASYYNGQNIRIPAGPAKATDYKNQLVFFFKGWSPAIDSAINCKDYIYTATYIEKPLYYKDTIHTHNGDSTIVVEYGKTPDLSDFDDDIPGCDYTLKFSGWTPSVVPQDTAAVRYTALYDTVYNRYNVTWKKYDDSVYDTASYANGDSIKIPAGPARANDYVNQLVFFFTGWTPAIDSAINCKDYAYTAVYREKPLYYKDTIHTGDGDSTILVEYGKTPDLTGVDIVRCEYTLKFKGWTPAVAKQDTFAVAYTALYDTIDNRFSVTWKKWDGSLIDAYTQQVGTPIVAPTDTARPRDTKVYTFVGWNPSLDTLNLMPCRDLVFIPQYTSVDRYYRDTVVTFGNVPAAITVEYGDTPDLTPYQGSYRDCSFTYNFREWNPAVAPQGDAVINYVADYDTIPNKYAALFVDYNGDTLKYDSVLYNDTVRTPADPVRPMDNAYIYTFAGWMPAVDTLMPCKDTKYTATYSKVAREYVDTVVLLDSTITITMHYGETPDLSQYAKDIVKCEKTYMFKDWSPAVAAQGTDLVTYTAIYDSTVNSFSVTWNNWDGSLIDAYNQNVGTPIVAPSDPTRPSDTKVYTFAGWSPSVDTLNIMPCRNVVFKAQFTSVNRYYKDTIVVFGDSVIVPQIPVEYGETPDLSVYERSYSDCAKTYNFRKWNPAVAPQDTNVIKYVADYDTVDNKYVALFVDYNGDTLKCDSVLYNDTVKAPADPVRPMDNMYIYTFAGWSPAVDTLMPCYDTKYKATYSKVAREFVDTIVLHDTTILITVHYGETPDLTQYEDTAYDCNSIYIFHNWKPAPKPQGTTPVRYEAYYTSTFRTYTVTWNNYNGSIYHLDTLQNGALVSVPVPNPVRLPDSTNIYFFDHWNPTPALTLSCEDLVYTAVFDSYPRFYDVPVHTKDTTDTLHNVQYGQTPDLSAYEDTVVHCDYTYIFDYWTPPVGPKGTDSVEYTAHYRQVANMYNVIWKNDYDTFAVTRATYGSPINGPRRTDTPTRPATQDSIYTFSGWQGWSATSKPIMDNCGDTVFYATYTAKSAFIVDTIVLKDTVLFDTVPYDSTAILTRYEGTVVHCDYTYIFDYWSPNPDSTPQPGYPISFTAVYTPVLNDYYITWVDADSVLRVDTLHCGAIPAHDPPMRDATCDSIYVFSHWTPQIVPVSANATYTAVFNREQRFHAITWYDAFGNVSYVDSLACDSMPVPTCQFIDGGDSVNYRLSGWLPAIHNVDGNESYYPVFDSEERIVTCDSTLNFTVCPGDTVTLPSGRVMVVNADEMVIDTVIDAIRKPYETLECYNNDSLVDLKVYVISVANFKNPLVDDHSIACPNRIVEGKAVKTGQTEMDIKAAFTGAAGELVPDWTAAQWMILDVNGNWVVYNNEEIRDREAGDTIRMKYVIPTNCQPIIVDLNTFGCDMSVHKSNADNCEQCQSDSAVIAVYDWLLMYEHAMMQAKGYNVTPDKIYWFAIGGDDWDNLDEWVVPMAIDDKYLGNGYYYTLNQPFNGSGDYYALVDVTNAGPKTQPCLGIMRSRKFRYTVAPANAPAAQIYPTKVSNSETVFVTGLQSNVKNEIYVYDASGKLVSHDTVTDDHYEFRAAGAAGTYRVVVITENDKQTLSFIIL